MSHGPRRDDGTIPQTDIRAMKLLRLLVAFCRLQGHQRAMAVEAVACLLLARVVVHRVPMRYWRGRIDGTEEGATPARRLLGRTVGTMVRRVACRLPVRAVCLPRAMAAQWMLRRRGVSSRLMFGVRRGAADRRLEYHAWLTVGGECVIGDHGVGVGTYVPLPAKLAPLG